MKTPTNGDDTIDGRDLQRRHEELRDERNELVDAINEAEAGTATGVNAAQEALEQWYADNGDELKALDAIENEYSANDTLIRDSYFETHAREEAESLGRSTDGWPFTCIDWERAANDLQSDYGSLEFDGVTYWIRQ